MLSSCPCVPVTLPQSASRTFYFIFIYFYRFYVFISETDTVAEGLRPSLGGFPPISRSSWASFWTREPGASGPRACTSFSPLWCPLSVHRSRFSGREATCEKTLYKRTPFDEATSLLEGESEEIHPGTDSGKRTDQEVICPRGSVGLRTSAYGELLGGPACGWGGVG